MRLPLLAAVALCAVPCGPALADAGGQPGGGGGTDRGQGSAPAEAAADRADAKEQAAASLARGTELFRRGEHDAALAEFLRSRRLYPARGNTLNAALALRELGRYDEALDLFETLLRDFPEIDARQREQVEHAVADLQGRVGTLELLVAEPAARVIIAGRERGRTPLSHPLRLSAGSHLVRVVKAGFVPLELRVEVAGGEQAVVQGRLDPLASSGTLKVLERGGQAAAVLVDGIEVGSAPWEGRLGPGRHTVRLRGADPLGTAPAVAVVRQDEVTAITLELERLDCWLRVAPTPIGAAVVLDGVPLGRGVWEGELRCGSHRLDVAEDGFLAARPALSLQTGERRRLDSVLEPDPEPDLYRQANPARVLLELGLGPALTPSLGGDVAAGCTGDCTTGVPFGGLASIVAGYQLPFGVGFGLDVGYAVMTQRTSARPGTATTVPEGVALVGTVDDDRLLHGLLLGGCVWLRRGTGWPLTARVSGGVFLGSLRDRRTTDLSGLSWELPARSADARYAFVAPQVRLGYAVAPWAALSLGLQAHLLFALARPTWEQGGDYFHEALGFVDFPTESLAGDVIVLLSPEIGASLSFY
ncbi:MAG: PEGA domain-containing protein [Deltaproteobacteria bacterium]|nr:PEGA domain-containing protein [Deltaproteobacteria bacterium]